MQRRCRALRRCRWSRMWCAFPCAHPRSSPRHSTRTYARARAEIRWTLSSVSWAKVKQMWRRHMPSLELRRSRSFRRRNIPAQSWTARSAARTRRAPGTQEESGRLRLPSGRHYTARTVRPHTTLSATEQRALPRARAARPPTHGHASKATHLPSPAIHHAIVMRTLLSIPGSRGWRRRRWARR